MDAGRCADAGVQTVTWPANPSGRGVPDGRRDEWPDVPMAGVSPGRGGYPALNHGINEMAPMNFATS